MVGGYYTREDGTKPHPRGISQSAAVVVDDAYDVDWYWAAQDRTIYGEGHRPGLRLMARQDNGERFNVALGSTAGQWQRVENLILNANDNALHGAKLGKFSHGSIIRDITARQAADAGLYLYRCQAPGAADNLRAEGCGRGIVADQCTGLTGTYWAATNCRGDAITLLGDRLETTPKSPWSGGPSIVGVHIETITGGGHGLVVQRHHKPISVSGSVWIEKVSGTAIVVDRATLTVGGSDRISSTGPVIDVRNAGDELHITAPLYVDSHGGKPRVIVAPGARLRGLEYIRSWEGQTIHVQMGDVLSHYRTRCDGSPLELGGIQA